MKHSILAVLLILGSVFAFAAQQESIDAMKQRVDQAAAADQVRLCLHIAQTQLQHMGDYYKTGDTENARRALGDVVTYGVRAANTSAQSGKHQKDTEIAVRKISFRLNDMARDADFDERPAIKAAIAKVDKAHDDLLASMFKKK
jgi:hypothetical protein